jgi:uncharacterized protein (DUF58 family)
MNTDRLPLITPALLQLSNRFHRFPFLPTSYGLLIIMVLIAILTGALNYENNLGLILAFLLIGMLLTSLLQTHRYLAGVTVKAGGKSFLFANKVGSLEVVILGRDNSHFSIQLRIPGGQSVTVPLFPGQPARVQLPLKPEIRGWLYLNTLEITTKFPFGLWHLRRYIALPGRLLVYPQPLVGPLRGASSETDIEGDQLNGSGVDDFLGLRPYVPGDLMQRVAWKASSRGQGLFTKEFGRLVGGMLHFDWKMAGPGDVETRLSRLCHLVLTAKARQLSYSLAIPNQTIPTGSGEVHGYRCLRALALFQEKG